MQITQIVWNLAKLIVSCCRKGPNDVTSWLSPLHSTNCSVYCTFPSRNNKRVCLLSLHIQSLHWMWWENPTERRTDLCHPIHHYLPVRLGCYPDIPPVTHSWTGHMWALQSGTNIIQVQYHYLLKSNNQCRAIMLPNFKILRSVTLATFFLSWKYNRGKK